MRAIILATGHRPALEPPVARRPDHLFPFLGKPFLQHVVEYLVERGVEEIHFVFSHLPQDAEELLGDGRRWGCRFEHHLARDERGAVEKLRVLARRWSDETLLLGSGNSLPALAAELPAPACVLGRGSAEAPDREWCGWAVLPAGALCRLPPGTGPEELLETLLEGGAAWREVPLALDLRSWERYLASIRAVLSHRFTGLEPEAREVEPQVWIGRNVVLHPSVRVDKPVFLAADVRIESGAVLGPYAAVESGSIVAPRASIQDAVVWPDTYVGEGLEIREAVVDRNCLVHVALGTSIQVRDDFLLGALRDGSLRRGLRHYGEGLVAALLLLLLSPVLLLASVALALTRRGPVLHRRRVLRLPAPADSATWESLEIRTFGAGARRPAERNLVERLLLSLRLDRLPALWDVFRGRLALAGAPPRTPEEVRELPPDWRALYLESRAGIATLAEVTYGEVTSSDERYSTEAYHAVHASFTFDLKLFLRWWLLPRPDQGETAAMAGTPDPA